MNRTVVDVIQYFSTDETEAVSHKAFRYYQKVLAFSAMPGWYSTKEALLHRIDTCFAPITASTYIVGKGLVGDLSPEEQRQLHTE